MASENSYPAEHPIFETVTIASGQSESNVIDVFEMARMWNVCLKGVIRDAGMTGTIVSFLVSVDNVNFYSLLDEDGDPIALTMSASAAAQRLQADDFAGWPYIKLKSNANEAANRTLKIMYYIV